jgi:hypothetical protein
LVPITGAIYNALDPKFIVNPYGLAVEKRFYGGKQHVRKEFALWRIGERSSPFPLFPGGVHTLYDIGSRRYCINDSEMTSAMARDCIELVYALKLDAVEKIGYKFDNGDEEVRIETKSIQEKNVDTPAVRYLLNDTEISYKIFNSINISFIRSMERITNKKKIEKYGYKECGEIVKISLFDYDIVSTDEGYGSSLYIVDGVPVGHELYIALNPYCFKEFNELHDGEEAYLRCKKEHPDKKYFSIISL